MTFSLIGLDKQTHSPVSLSRESRREGTYIIGTHGTGKSALLLNLILQDITAGIGVCVIDPHGDLVEDVLSRIRSTDEGRIILLDLIDEDFPFGLNLLEVQNTNNLSQQRVISQVMNIFKKVFDQPQGGAIRIEQLLRVCARTIIANPGYTIADVSQLLNDKVFRAMLVSKVTDPTVKTFWNNYERLSPAEKIQRAEGLDARLDAFLSPILRNIVGQSQTTIRFWDIMQDRKVLLLKLDKRLGDVSALLGAVMLSQILNAGFARQSLPMKKRKSFHIYVDEFPTMATEDFSTLLTEARKFGIGTTIAHQARHQPGMTDAIRTTTLQASNLIVFRVSGEDGRELAKEFDTTAPPAAEIEEEIEGEERQVEILTPVKDVFGHLLSRGSHPNPVVNQFVFKVLQPMEQIVQSDTSGYNRRCVQQLNAAVYEAMTGNYPYLSLTYMEPFRFLEFWQHAEAMRKCPDAVETLMNEPDWTRCQQEVQQVKQVVFEFLYYWSIQDVGRAKYNLEQAYQRTKPKKGVPSWRQPEYILEYPTLQDFLASFTLPSGTPSWIHIDLSSLQWDSKRELIAGQEKNWYEESEVKRFVQQKVDKEQTAFHTFVQELHAVMHALAAEPLLTGSGRYEIKPRKQRRVLQQLTSAEMEGRIANTLSKLPPHTARVRVSLEEHTIETIEPEHGCSLRELAERTQAIQERMLQEGYIRPRADVEEEISQRLSGTPPQSRFTQEEEI